MKSKKALASGKLTGLMCGACARIGTNDPETLQHSPTCMASNPWRNSPMIDMIIGRLHVSESNLAACRYLLSRMKPGYFWKLPKQERRQIIDAAVYAHKQNRDTYISVMRGY